MAYNAFNDADAKAALESANQEISNLLDTFQKQRESTNTNFGNEGVAIGGRAGATAQSTFESSSGEGFNKLNEDLDEFIKLCQDVVKENAETTQAVEAAYGNN